jgi:hypothetical protein
MAIAVSPASWTMVAGTSVSLQAYLVGGSGCFGQVTLFTWAFSAGSGPLGYLNSTQGASNQFRAFPYGSGVTELDVDAVGLEWCGLFAENFSASTSVPVRVVAPLLVEGLVPSGDPVVPGSSVTLTADLLGGLPPYRAYFEFGDGGEGVAFSSSAGNLSVTHVYTAGTYAPSVTVVDGLGEAGNASASRPILASPRIALSIEAPRNDLDLGVPLLLTAQVLNSVGTFTISWNDSDGNRGVGDSFALNASRPGPDVVTAEVTDGAGDRGNASVTLSVAPALAVSGSSSSGTIDLGGVVRLSVAIEGGCAPYRLSAESVPGGSRFTLMAIVAHQVVGALVPDATGPFWAEVDVADSFDVTDSILVPLGTVVNVPALEVNLTATSGEVGLPLGLVATVLGGASPINWTVDSTAPLGTSTPRLGTLDGDGVFAWSGSVAASGLIGLAVTVRDGTGATVVWNRSISIASALKVSLVAASNGTASHAWPVAVAVDGGLPPYAIDLSGNDGENRAGNLSGPGTFAWSPVPADPGPWSVEVVVQDALGATAATGFNATVSAGPAAPVAPNPGSSDPGGSSASEFDGAFAGGLGAALGVGLIGTVGWFLLRGRLRPARPSAGRVSPTALAAVRRLVTENEGIDRETLGLLAEEEGVEEAAVEAALLRWEALGRIRREPSGDGGSTLAWEASAPPTPGALPASEPRPGGPA